MSEAGGLEADEPEGSAILPARGRAAGHDVPCIVTDGRGVITAANDAAGRLLGASPRSLRGSPLALHVSVPHRARLDDLLSRVEAGACAVHRVELAWACPPGHERRFAVSVASVPQGAEPLLCWLAHEEAGPEERERALEDALGLRTAVLLGAAHDMRGALSVVAGMGALLEEHLDELDPERLLDVVVRLNRNTRRLSQVVTDLLDVGRLLEDRIGVVTEDVDVIALVRSAIRATELRGHVVHISAPAAVTTRLDPGLFRRIVVNLLDNAVRHAPDPEGIRVTLSLGAEGLLLAVEDRGPGVPPERSRTLFELSSAAAPGGEGLGLGLYVVRRFAELQGGAVWVEDRAGGGSSFKVRLPGA